MADLWTAQIWYIIYQRSGLSKSKSVNTRTACMGKCAWRAAYMLIDEQPTACIVVCGQRPTDLVISWAVLDLAVLVLLDTSLIYFWGALLGCSSGVLFWGALLGYSYSLNLAAGLGPVLALFILLLHGIKPVLIISKEALRLKLTAIKRLFKKITQN